MFGALPDDPDRPNLPNQPAGPTGTPRAEPTDQFLADQFVKAYARKELIHVPAKAGGVWMRCGGGIWAPDYTAGEEAGVVCRTASDFIRRQPNPTQAQLTLARSIDSARIQTAVLNIAKTRKACSVAPELLDSRLSFMGVPGGYIDPEGKLRDPDPSLFLTRKAGCRPDFDAKCPMFDGLVRSLANFDKDVEDCLWRMVGYTITGVGDQQMFPFLHGKGNEGKTTFFTILAQVFGDYAKTFKPVIFMLGQDHRFASSAFAGAWFIYGSEIAKGARWDDAAIKEATGGGETSVEKKYVDVYQARIRFMPWFSGNNLPHFSGSDTALKRRMALFRCMRPFESVISSFDQKVFEAEGPAILAKAIRYRQGYFERQPAGNFVLAPQVQAWTTEHFEHNDATGQFIDDCLAAEKNDAAPPLLKSVVYRRFQEYARGSLGQGEAFILSKNRFFDEFEEHPKLRALGGNVCRKRLGGRDTNPQFCVTGVRLIQLFENLSAEGL
jgi:putative DNA primase/helicase